MGTEIMKKTTAIHHVPPRPSFDLAEKRAPLILILPDGIMQPKTGSAADVVELSAMLDRLEDTSNLPSGSTRVIAIATETAGSLFHVGTYGNAGPRLHGMA